MSKFLGDPILNIYIHMLDKTQSNLELPEYSEIFLRLAFKEVYGKKFALSSEILQLYRKLLVLLYCEEYPLLTSVTTIMERCFSKEEVCNIIAEKDDILSKWGEFKS